MGKMGQTVIVGVLTGSVMALLAGAAQRQSERASALHRQLDGYGAVELVSGEFKRPPGRTGFDFTGVGRAEDGTLLDLGDVEAGQPYTAGEKVNLTCNWLGTVRITGRAGHVVIR